MSTGRKTGSASYTKLVIDLYIISRTVIAEFRRTDRYASMTVHTFLRINKNNRFKIFHDETLYDYNYKSDYFLEQEKISKMYDYFTKKNSRKTLHDEYASGYWSCCPPEVIFRSNKSKGLSCQPL